MRRATMAFALALLAASLACEYDPGVYARVRAANEFDCHDGHIDVEPRLDLSPYTVDVSACGHDARYTCPPGGRHNGSPACTREPLE